MQENIHKSEDDISIATIKKAVLNFFRFFFNVGDFIIVSIQRRLGLFTFCCLIGIAGGWVYYWQNSNYYKTEMILQSNDLSKKAYQEIIKNLNDLVATQSFASLSSQLNLDKQISKQIVSIEAVSINNGSLSLDTSIKIKEPFKIQMKTSSASAIPILQDVLVKYLKSSPYLRTIKEGEKKIYIEKLKFVDYEQKRLDSLISAYRIAVTELKMPTTFYNNVVDPAALYQHALKLDSVREKAQRWLNNESEAILVIDGFKTPDTPQSVSLLFSVLIGLASGVLLGTFLVALSVLRAAVR